MIARYDNFDDSVASIERIARADGQFTVMWTGNKQQSADAHLITQQ